ncbi:MAG: hypothetical protein A3K19_10330 [Lentisphaerae bacterium RIFOXYB12_FULL_65_16]|nr:MAG: hypothetical protein A3K18_32190 [Lentisphaerae bacterium RIFOXYA12_64_32]OGV91613.1 MAG: hypothetical protein A3K19_10330 [Lentisphaerae bacterium RIFOXYB12_FULL_65_16]
MTLRSVLLGLFGAATICGLNYINDNILRQTYLVGNNMPVSVYGALILFVILVNPFLKRWAMTGRELAVAMTLTLAACCIPASGLLRTFTTSLMLPHHYQKVEPGWSEQGVVSMAPKRMLADPSQNEDEALTGFIQGMGIGEKHIGFGQIPWYAWTQTLLFWIPLILALWFGTIALSVVLHRQWSHYEHLPYPIAQFADSLLPAEGQASTSLFRNRLFWIGTLAIFVVHLNNYAFQWFPDYLLEIPVKLNLAGFAETFPAFQKGGGTRLLIPVLYFTVIGLAYFLPSDVAFSVGIGPFLWAIVAGVLAGYGVAVDNIYEGSAWYTGVKPKTFLLFGANLGVFLAVLYSGRHFFGSVLRRSVGLTSRDEVEKAEVWSFRAFMLFMVIFCGQLVSIGVDWQLSVLYMGVLVLFYVVMSRLIAETGMFYIQPYFFPCTVIWGLVGSRALGPEVLLILMMVSMVLVIDPRESLMPFMTNSFKMLELRSLRIGRMALLAAAAVIIGLAVALPVTLYFQYDRGYAQWDGWASRAVPLMPFQNMVSVKRKLAAQGTLEQAGTDTGWRRLAHSSPNGPCVLAMTAGLVLVLICATSRLRFTWWPLHPVLFLTWATEPMWRMCGAFLIGWLIKALVTKYGGLTVYQKLKPLMIGLIAGEILGAVFPSIIGAIYFSITGKSPVPFLVLPG